MRRETFAPILYVMRYASSPRPSPCRTTCRRACRRRSSPTTCARPSRSSPPRGSDCGIANVNIGPSGAEIGGAFGGEKETGGGREAGSDAGRPTCAAPPTPSTTAAPCRSPRASSSTSSLERHPQRRLQGGFVLVSGLAGERAVGAVAADVLGLDDQVQRGRRGGDARPPVAAQPVSSLLSRLTRVRSLARTVEAAAHRILAKLPPEPEHRPRGTPHRSRCRPFWRKPISVSPFIAWARTVGAVVGLPSQADVEEPRLPGPLQSGVPPIAVAGVVVVDGADATGAGGRHSRRP